MSTARVMAIWAAVLLLGAAAAVWFWWRPAPPPPPLPSVAAPAPPAVASAPPPVALASTPAAAPPVPEPVPASAPLAAEGVAPAITALLGAKAVQSALQLDDFAHRFVATIDNLGRAHAPASLWPVRPTAGRFEVIERDGQTFASPDNGLRYTPFVLLAERLDARAAADLYVRLLPLLQAAYEELGFPKARFHARLMAVVDLLLAAPDAPQLIPLTLTEVKGDVPSTRPWVRYEFADRTLEAASAGQKIMMRVGAVNEHRLKAKLRELRAALQQRAPGAAPN